MIVVKKILAFFGLFAYVIGSIGGVAYCLYIHEAPTALCVAVLASMAFPTAKKWYNFLLSKSDEK